MAITDIRAAKQQLREKQKEWRLSLPLARKQKMDAEILSRLIHCRAYQRAKWVLTYVSTPIEVDTHHLIEQALQDGKTVAVPRCISGTRLMEFCLIQSMEDLEPGSFSVLEPKKSCKVVSDFPDAICVVPGLAFDRGGYRLGYGKGYYDRFLSGFEGAMIGVCYTGSLELRLPHGKFDRKVQWLVTNKFIKTILP